MKPDQHKKKKNLQYKKKHGITDSKSVAKGDEQNTNRNKDNKKGACGKGLPDKITQKQALVKSDSDKTASDDETASEKKTRSNFQRRKVQSNWQQYECLDSVSDDARDDAIGADMVELLATASSAASQFRFKDETTWNDDDLELAVDEASELLSINTQALSDALQCVPLHVRLSIEPEAFKSEQITQFQQHAQEKERLLNNKTEQSIPTLTDRETTSNDFQSTTQLHIAASSLDDIEDDILDSILGNDIELTSAKVNKGTVEIETVQVKADMPCSGVGELHQENISDDLHTTSDCMDNSSSSSPILPLIASTVELPSVELPSDELPAEDISEKMKAAGHNAESIASSSSENKSHFLKSDGTNLSLPQNKSCDINQIGILEDDLDDLLSLSEPVVNVKLATTAVDTGDVDDIDWLDSMLDD